MAFTRELEHEDGQAHLEKERGIAVGARCCPAVGCSYVQKAAAALDQGRLRFGLLIRVSKGSRRVPAADYPTTRRGVMTEITHERRAPADGQKEQSTTEQAMQKVQETGGEVRQQVGQKAQELRTQAGAGIRRQLDGRSTEAGEEVTTTADALRRVGDQLRQEGKTGSAKYAERAAQPVERLGRYLTEADGDRLLRDAEQFARRRPWVAVMGGATLGFLVARFIKASNTGDGATEQNDRYAQAALSPASGLERGEFDDKSRQ